MTTEDRHLARHDAMQEAQPVLLWALVLAIVVLVLATVGW